MSANIHFMPLLQGTMSNIVHSADIDLTITGLIPNIMSLIHINYKVLQLLFVILTAALPVFM